MVRFPARSLCGRAVRGSGEAEVVVRQRGGEAKGGEAREKRSKRIVKQGSIDTRDQQGKGLARQGGCDAREAIAGGTRQGDMVLQGCLSRKSASALWMRRRKAAGSERR